MNGLKVFKAEFDSITKTFINPDSIFAMEVDLLHLTYPADTVESKEKYGLLAISLPVATFRIIFV